jgi:arginase
MKKDIHFIINKSELTAGTRGASLGPEALFVAARAVNNRFFNDFNVEELPNYNYLLDQPVEHAFAKRVGGLIQVYTDVSSIVSEKLAKQQFPFLLSGDHGSAGGTIAGIKKAYPTKRLGVIWVDAHGDLHTPYTTPSGNMHGMPLATVLNEDNLACQINDVPVASIDAWNLLKNTGFEGAKIQPEDLIFIAVRDTEAQEDVLIERLQIKNYTVAEVEKEGAIQIAQKALEDLNDCDIIYVSFDVDSMDPVHTSFGTGTPVANGLHPNQAKDILNTFCTSSKLVCMEFVEINPCLDDKMNKMAEISFSILESIVTSNLTN